MLRLCVLLAAGSCMGLVTPACLLFGDGGGGASDVQVDVDIDAASAVGRVDGTSDDAGPSLADATPDASAPDSAGDGETGDADAVGDAADAAEVEVEVWAAPLPEHVFRDGNEEVGLPELYSSTVSVADINGDGHVDLLSGGRFEDASSPTAIFLRVPGGGFEQHDLQALVSNGEEVLRDVVSTSIADLNLDGRADLLLGGFEAARLQVLFQRDGFVFEAAQLYESGFHPGAKLSSIEVADVDGNGLPDIYLAIKWPPQRFSPWAITHGNRLLTAVGVEAWQNTSKEFMAFFPCANKQTYSAQFIPRALWGDPALLHVINDMHTNCLWTVAPALPLPEIQWFDEAWEVMSDADYSMGGDWMYSGSDGDLVMLSVEVGYHILYAIRDGVLTEESSRVEWPDKDYVGWGGLFADFDNDGDEDLVVASGKAYDNDQQLQFASQWHPIGEPAFTSKLLYWEHQDDGTFRYDSPGAGPYFAEETGEYFGVAVADLNEDGCLDLIATPRAVIDRLDTVPVDPMSWTYEVDTWKWMAPGVRVLLNNCPAPDNGWIAFRVPDRPGVVVRLTLADGTQRLRAVKGNVGVAMRSGGGVVHFGLGLDGAVDKAELFDVDGDLLATSSDLTTESVNALGLD